MELGFIQHVLFARNIGEIDLRLEKSTLTLYARLDSLRSRRLKDLPEPRPEPTPEPVVQPPEPLLALESVSPPVQLPELSLTLEPVSPPVQPTPGPAIPSQPLDGRSLSLTVPEQPQPVFRARGRPRRQPLGFISAFTPATSYFMGTFTEVCTFCSALHWPEESSMRCCKEGDITLELFQQPPDLLAQLFTGDDLRAKEFLLCIRQYNSALAFTSLSYNKDQRANELGPGLTCFSIYGNLYHMQGPLHVGPGATLAFAQLFFYDSDYATDLRSNRQPALDRVLLPAFQLALNPQIELVVEGSYHRRRISLPTSNEIAAIIPDETSAYRSRDIVLASRSKDSRESNLTRILDQFSFIFYRARLFQQYAVDAYVIVETSRLDWHRQNQLQIQADLYQCVYDALHASDTNVTDIGHRVILPSMFSKSDRHMQQLFRDVMALVRYFGKLTYFITMTANPNWPEIQNSLLPGQFVTDRPDLVARVFEGKRRELVKDLKNGVLGLYGGYGFTVEYQKRGLPHIHFLFYGLHNSAELSQNAINEVICAEIPDPNRDLYGTLRELVLTNMVHHLCGPNYPNSPCMKRATPAELLRCSKRFPKRFTDVTILSEDGYPEYHRRNDGQRFVHKLDASGQPIIGDNRWIVPYNPYLLQKFNCHLNVEICNTIQAVKYIHKYVYKGNDRSTLAVNYPQDEIQQYVQARYVSPIEAFAHLMEYKTHQEWPSVTRLLVHLQGEHTVRFHDDMGPDAIANQLEVQNSKLMAFFKYNSEHGDGRQWLYQEFPEHYVWNMRNRCWTIRKQGTSIGRMYYCSPAHGERFYLRLLLTSVRGPRSFEELYSSKYELSTGVTASGMRLRTAFHFMEEATVASRMQAQLNQDQRECFDTIVIAVENELQRAHFYLQGPGRSGKNVLCVASTGIAALLLPASCTAHSQFRILLELNESSVSSISKISRLATQLRKVDLIIWDEVPMQHKYCFEVVHRLFCDLQSVEDQDLLFGGLLVILGGDFAQILPVVVGSTRADAVNACLQRSFIWSRLRKLRLRTNMRVQMGDGEADFVRWIGSLPYNTAFNGPVSIPSTISTSVNLEALINSVYPLALLQIAFRDYTAFRVKALLTTLNQTVKVLNETVMTRFPGFERTYLSVDSADVNEQQDDQHTYAVEVLQAIDLTSLPSSKLTFKIGAPVMLIRNFCPSEGLCNGTRMVITALRNRSIEAQLLAGEWDGQVRTIPRIKLSSNKNDLPFTFTCKQFPLRVCFAMTVNKSQGQSFDRVGLDLRLPVFTHGQFYVAVSRTTSVRGLSILLPEGATITTNVVYPEVLNDLTV
ncbi:hypothetical protein B7463_g12712, partial [Scytalidium lignicola]